MGNLLTCVKGKKAKNQTKLDRIDSVNIKNRQQVESKIEIKKEEKQVVISSDTLADETIRKSLTQVQEFASDKLTPLNSSPVKRQVTAISNLHPLDVSEILLNETVEEEISVEDTLDLIANEICDNSWIDNTRISTSGTPLCIKNSSTDLRVNIGDMQLNQDMRAEISDDSILPSYSKSESIHNQLNLSNQSVNPETVALPTLSDVLSIQSIQNEESRPNVLVQPFTIPENDTDNLIDETRRNAILVKDNNITDELRESLKVINVSNLNTDPCDNEVVLNVTPEIETEEIIQDDIVYNKDYLKPVVDDKVGDTTPNASQKKKRRPKRNRSKRKEEKPTVNVK